MIIKRANLECNSIITRMINRKINSHLIDALDNSTDVALHGPRQVGKTTLALEISSPRPSLYLDLESISDRSKLTDPETYLSGHVNSHFIS